MLRLKADGGCLGVGDAAGGEPDVEEALGEEAADALVVGAVARRVEARREGEEEAEEPSAVVVEEVAAHDEHIAYMRASRTHVGIIGCEIARRLHGDGLAQTREVAGVVRVGVLGGVRLDEVMPPMRQEDRRAPEGALEVRPRIDALRAAAEAGTREVAAVVHEAEVIVVAEVFPGPVERGQLAERSVLPADVLARVVAEELRPRSVQGAPDLDGEIDIVLRHLIWFMCCNQHAYFHASYHLFLYCLWITTHYINTNAPPYKTSLLKSPAKTFRL